jgi:hypothetical protein
MRNGEARNVVEEDPRGGGGKQSGNPIVETRGEAPLQKVKDVLPTNGIDFYTHPLREATREVLQFWHMSTPTPLLRKHPRLFLV